MNRTSGVDADAFLIARPGDSVITPDGVGVVVSVEHGPAPRTETYTILLDDKVSGGEYPASVVSLASPVDARLARRYSGVPFACDDCGTPAHSSVSGGRQGHTMLCDGCRQKRGKSPRKAAALDYGLYEEFYEQGRSGKPLDYSSMSGMTAEEEDEAEQAYFRGVQSGFPKAAARQFGLTLADKGSVHTAADDYPELSDILWERPDLYASEPVGKRMGSLSSVSETPVSIRREAVTPKDIRQGKPIPGTTRVPQGQRTPQYRDDNPFPTYQTAQDAIDDPATPWWWRKLVGPAVERYERARGYSGDVGHLPSRDWCRFRKNSRCMYPRNLDEQGTAEAGYPVWIPEDRGPCWRIAWDDQKVCSIAEPGPNSMEKVVFPDATVPWSQGGQRKASLHSVFAAKSKDDELGDCYEAAANFIAKEVSKEDESKFFLCHGIVVGTGGDVVGVRYGHAWVEMEPESGFGTLVIDRSNGRDITLPKELYYRVGSIDPANVIRYTKQQAMAKLSSTGHYGPWDKRVDASIKVVAGWRDVQQKAKRIAQSGGVRIIAVSGDTITADVRGQSAVYQTGITRVPGTRQVALWSCGCPWSTYSWGRSGRWKKYEGRMCAHALALVYKAQKEEMFGGKVVEQSELPDWWKEDTKRILEQRSAPPGTWRLDVAAALTSHLAGLESMRDLILRQTNINAGERAVRANGLSVSASVVRAELNALAAGEDFTPSMMTVIPDSKVDVHPFEVLVGGVVGQVTAIDPLNLTCDVSGVGCVPLCWCEHPKWNTSEGIVPPKRDKEPVVAKSHVADDIQWLEANGGLSVLNDEPEPALPRTEGESEAEVDSEWDRQRETDSVDMNLSSIFTVAQSDQSVDSRAWLMSGSTESSQDTTDIAVAARQFLAKTALKDFSAAEQAEIIEEGKEVRAANLNLLQIEGTHYQALEADSSDEFADSFF